MNYVLMGDGLSPHLLKWARALHRHGAGSLTLHALSSRGFLPGFDDCIPAQRRLALDTQPDVRGGNLQLLRELPRVSMWLWRIRPQMLHAHYLSSHGTLAWLAKLLFRVPGKIVGSAWGSDILVTPDINPYWKWLTRRVLMNCSLCTSDSRHMAARMTELGARQVMVFPFGLESLPEEATGPKEPWLFFSNRALEPWYQPQRVIQAFWEIHRRQPTARLVMANEGSERESLQALVAELGMQHLITFTGRLDEADQAQHYRRAQWYLSLPRSDSVSVSVIEAMAHGCIPILSQLPANRELVNHLKNGLLLTDKELAPADAAMKKMLAAAARIAADNRTWVARNALFAPCIMQFLKIVRALP